MHICKSERPKTKDLRLMAERGFTLIELSIVIVIIGLIVAGVVGGQALVEQAKFRSIITDYNKFNVAVNAFKLEYVGLPGDFKKAADYGIGTSGNGDGKLTGGNGCARSYRHDSEFTDFWRHLSNANLLEGRFVGGVPTESTIDSVLPKSKLGTYWGAHSYRWDINYSGIWKRRLNGGGYTLSQTANMFLLGVSPSNAPYNTDYYFTPQEMYNIDAKIDDKMPFTGLIQARAEDSEGTSAYSATCVGVVTHAIYQQNAIESDNACATGTTSRGSANSVYHIANPQKKCVLAAKVL